MSTIAFSSLDCVELTQEEQIQTEGGIIPLVAIGVAWGAMIIMSAVAVGMKAAYDEAYPPSNTPDYFG